MKSGTLSPIRLMVVDDSVTARAVFTRIIRNEPDLELAGLASTGEEALEKLRDIEADVILLDLEMPGMGGLAALPLLLEQARGAQVMVVSTLAAAGAEQTVKALALGAADTSPKPQPGCFNAEYCQALVAQIRALGGKRAALADDGEGAVAREVALPTRPAGLSDLGVLALGASTGGLHALGQFFLNLPTRIGVPILITQHIPASFVEAFASQVALVSKRKALVAQAGMEPEPDVILVAPGDAHLILARRHGRIRVQLDDTPNDTGCIPSVDPMFASLAPLYGAQALGIVFSGMGRDGTKGGRAIIEAGGAIMAQDERSSAVWGMPGSVAKEGLASAVLPPDELAYRVGALVRVAA